MADEAVDSLNVDKEPPSRAGELQTLVMRAGDAQKTHEAGAARNSVENLAESISLGERRRVACSYPCLLTFVAYGRR
jgi:hypothetical protein